MPKTPMLLIGVATLGTVHIDWAFGLRLQGLPMNAPAMLYRAKGFTVHDARDAIVNYAARRSIPFVLFYDDDMMPRGQWDIINMFHTITQNEEIDILSAVYPARIGDYPQPIVYKERGKGIWMGWRDGGLHKVWGAGTAFCIIRMESLNKIKVPFKNVNGELIPSYFGDMSDADDMYLARLAEAHGLNWYINADIIADQMDRDGTWYIVDERKGKVLSEAEPKSKTRKAKRKDKKK